MNHTRQTQIFIGAMMLAAAVSAGYAAFVSHTLHTYFALAVLVLAAAAAAGCASTAPRAVIPPEFRAACGHPGAQVQVRKVPVTIPHAACDLTGVAIRMVGLPKPWWAPSSRFRLIFEI